jgi:Peptidase family M23
MRFRALAAIFLLLAGPAGAAESPGPRLDFYPQAGILWQDLYPSNFVDLRAGPGIEDWACGGQTYDGHTGADTIIRSFAEKTIGVPVFAALDGVVSAVQDGLPDESRGGANPGPDNHVELDSGGGYRTIYGHLRRNSVSVRVGERVLQGQQIGFTASSGNSTWPHLHFTLLRGAEVLEPFAGTCRPGAPLWRSQPETPPVPSVRDVAVSARPMFGLSDLPFDETVRTGTFVVGPRHVDLRIELGTVWDRGAWSLRIERPDGTAAWTRSGSMSWPVVRGTTRARWGMRLDLDTPGRWRILFLLGDRTMVDAPLEVVATRAEVVNRPPNAIAVDAVRHPGGSSQCFVRTSLASEDPDYELVRYRYRWTVGDAVVRDVTSAGLSDVLSREHGPATCSVKPSDGKLDGPEASAVAR